MYEIIGKMFITLIIIVFVFIGVILLMTLNLIVKELFDSLQEKVKNIIGYIIIISIIGFLFYVIYSVL